MRVIVVGCPYCQFVNSIKVAIKDHGWLVWTCDSEEGGCDSQFVVRYRVKIEAVGLKIEGQAEQGGDNEV